MITKSNLPELLIAIGYSNQNNIFTKTFNQNTNRQFSISVDMENEKFIYPKEILIHRETTTNFSDNENFVVFEILNRLFDLGYMPKNIELEMLVKVGRGRENVTAWADVLLKDNSGNYYAIIEAKTYGDEFSNAWKKTLIDGYQLFSYVDQLRSKQSIPYGILYASDFRDGKVERKYHLLTFKDNEEFLKEQKKKKRKLYVNSSNEKELFEVWTATYDQDYSPIGMFEDDSKPFGVMEKQFTIKDIYNNPLETDGLIHQFRTILRQHNVAGRENAFDRLLNLLLAKVVDEKQSEQTGRPLDFYWRGVAFDDKKSLVDRLQRLYRDGMRDYLKEDVTYIDKNDVDNAFVLFKNDKDATRDLIQNYFEKLKFYTDNFFAFIDVYNEDLFEKNFEILSSIVRLFQDVSLTNSEQHQFLGDLFEKLLDQGIKQSEGQFFTPLPIVRFIVSSLPIKDMIENGQVPKAIDYASGSGHFLTEYASEISKLGIPTENLPTYYQNIYGIEKESRLAKVSKVSALMYGATETQIFFHDALSKFEEVKDGSFDIIIANPPYSVTGFLETLSQEDRENYELINFVSDISKNNSIEAFFVERAKQLLKNGGIAAIILPNSIINNGDSVYTKVRKILLETFDIIAIFEASVGTFGKTGTTTDTLFLRKKLNKVNLFDHYTNRVEAWFKEDFNKDEVFEDKEKLETFAFLLGKSVDDVLTDDSLKQRLIYYLIAENQENEVVIVKTPTLTKEIKKYLGYEWSTRKGYEGIKLLTGNIQTIETPLYNPQDYYDETKVNSAIRAAFLGEDIKSEYVTKRKLSSMISWDNQQFDLSININKSEDFLNLKIEGAKTIKELPISINKETFIPEDDKEYYYIDIKSVQNGTGIIDYQNVIKGKEVPSRARRKIEDQTTLISTVRPNLKGFAFVSDVKENTVVSTGFATLKSEDETIILNKYIFTQFMQSELIMKQMLARMTKGQYPSVNKTDIENLQILVPPIEEQLIVVKEYERIEDEQLKAQEEIDELQSKVDETLERVGGENHRLDSVTSQLFAGGDAPKDKSDIKTEEYQYPIYSNGEKNDGLYGWSKVAKVDEAAVTISARGTIGFVKLREANFTPIVRLIVAIPNKDKILPKMLEIALKNLNINSTGVTTPQLTVPQVSNLIIMVPDMDMQNEIITEVNNLEERIKDLQHTIDKLELEKKKLFS